MRKEIGSEFWDVPVTDGANDLFPDGAQWYLSGRSALKAIIQETGKSRSVCLPSWCCDSMIQPFAEAGYDIRFYPADQAIGRSLKMDYDCDVLFVMDYFGYTAPPLTLKAYHGIVIRDVTHSLFSHRYQDADYYFGSLRKWCSVGTGGFAWSGDGHPLPDGKETDDEYVALRTQAMSLKKDYVEGKPGADKSYLKLFNEAEERLENIGIVRAAERDIRLAKKIDAEFIRIQRRRNAQILRQAFPDWLIFPEMRETDCPMFVPVLVPNGKRDELRRYLIRHDIYCPVHWPMSDFHHLDEQERSVYENELSLVCDQRYTEQDMNRFVKMIDHWMEAQ